MTHQCTTTPTRWRTNTRGPTILRRRKVTSTTTSTDRTRSSESICSNIRSATFLFHFCSVTVAFCHRWTTRMVGASTWNTSRGTCPATKPTLSTGESSPQYSKFLQESSPNLLFKSLIFSNQIDRTRLQPDQCLPCQKAASLGIFKLSVSDHALLYDDASFHL